MLKKELAERLGISPPMVTKLAKRGMPTDSVERAERWRRRHLEPGRVKGARYEPKRRGDLVATANTLADAARANFDAYADRLREAMHKVPERDRDHVAIHVEVWRKLIGEDEIEAMEDNHAQAEADAGPDGLGPATPEENRLFGQILYAAACGEWPRPIIPMD